MVLNMRINLIPRPCLKKFGLLFAVWFLEPCKGFPVTEPLTPCVTTNLPTVWDAQAPPTHPHPLSIFLKMKHARVVKTCSV